MGAGASTPRGEPPPRIPASALAGTWKACSKHKWQLDEEHYGKSAAAIAEQFDQIVRVGTSDGVHRWSYGSVCSGTTTFYVGQVANTFHGEMRILAHSLNPDMVGEEGKLLVRLDEAADELTLLCVLGGSSEAQRLCEPGTPVVTVHEYYTRRGVPQEEQLERT